jgi:SAM-dependent methyltransferase
MLTASEPPVLFYDDIAVHRRLVADDVRTGAFHDSIMATVRPGDVVLDVGAGSGILSLFAARAGAARVYAVERAPGAVALARRLVDENRVGGIIRVVPGAAERVLLPERVDVLVSEWLGVFGVDENMLGGVLAARDRWLKRGGVMIPGAVTAWIAPVAHPAGEEAIEFRTRAYALDLTPLAPFPLDEGVWLAGGATPDHLCAPPQPMWVTDPATMPARETRTPYVAEHAFRLERDGVNGLVVWFSALMPGAGELTNAPGAPPTHWSQFLFPLATAHALAPGDELRVRFECIPAGAYGSHYRWSAPGRELHDTRRGRRRQWMPPWRPSYAGVPAPIEGG